MFLFTGLTACHEKRGLHEAPGKSAKTSSPKVCPYSHPSSQNSSGSSAGNSQSTSADLCKTTPKHFKTMCRRPTPPGISFCLVWVSSLIKSSNVPMKYFVASFQFLTLFMHRVIKRALKKNLLVFSRAKAIRLYSCLLS